jgi:hypothetical protein
MVAEPSRSRDDPVILIAGLPESFDIGDVNLPLYGVGS